MSNAKEVDTSPAVDQDTPKTPEQDNTVKETEAKETDKDESSDESEDSGGEEVQKTPEERLAEIESKLDEREKKIERSKAAYRDLQKAYDGKLQELEQLKTEIKPQEPLQEPSIEDFDNFDEFQKARDDYITKRAEQQAFEKFQESQLKEQQMRLAQERDTLVKSQEAEYLTVNPDYAASKATFEAYGKLINARPEVEQAIVGQAFKGNVPQLIDYFAGNDGENIDALREISAMSPTDAAVEIYKIQQRLKAPEKEEVKPAPKPIQKPKGGGAPRKNLKDGSVLENLGLK